MKLCLIKFIERSFQFFFGGSELPHGRWKNFKSLRSPILSLVISLFASISQAQSIPGYDVLGVARYCKTFLQSPKLPAMSVLLNTFGDPMPCVEKRIALGDLKLVQVDIRDATCFRNKVCPPGTPALDDWKVMREGAKRVNAYAEKYKNIEWWVSPWLEHDIKDYETVRKGFQVVANACPRCKLINSPVSGVKPPEFKVELHGTKVRSFSVSGDGASIFDGDNLRSDGNGFQHRTAGEYTTFAWFNEMNLRCTGEHGFVPPMQRTTKPTLALFTQAYLVMQKEQAFPAIPKQCKSFRDILPGKEINKPNAEAYCNGQPNESDSRGNRQLLILRKPGKKGDRLNVINPSGKKVGTFCYYGTFDQLPQTHRWYIGNCSGQNPVELYNALNGEWGYVEMGGGNCLRFNAIRRQGVYR